MRRSGVAVLMVPALGLVPLGTGRGEEAPREGAAWKRFTETYRAAVARQGVVGSSLVLVHDGEVAARVACGLADREAARPVDDDTIFHWASITKTFTGIAILQLRDRGKLGLDDPVVKYLPELRQVHDPFGDTLGDHDPARAVPQRGLPRSHLALGRRQGLASLRAHALGPGGGAVPLHPGALPPAHPLQPPAPRGRLPRPDHRAARRGAL